ncbi:hypothetical protein DFJ77DRAFT_510088 [Powellomyces hirtus]|nr:hypothetical protein DFJ77DRAFT_510088 [Powellomyces hirtus]
MEQDLTNSLASKTQNLDRSIARLNGLLQPILERPLDQQLGKLEVFDRAKLDVLLAFALNSLVFVYLKTQGASTKEHPVKRELDRVKEYFKKLKEAGGMNKNTMRLDRDAAKRFVTNSLITNEEVSREVKKRKAEAEADQFLQNVISTSVPPTPVHSSSGPGPRTSTPAGRSEGELNSSDKKRKRSKK